MHLPKDQSDAAEASRLHPSRRPVWLALLAGLLSLGALQLLPLNGQSAFVIHVSVDGLRPDAVTALGPTTLSNFYRLRSQGAFTDNARCDYDVSVTLPNHACQLTGRPVLGSAGHGWSSNDDPLPQQTLASNKGSYVAGVFDVTHDRGLRTGLYASKTKFSLFSLSWDATNGAPDALAPDNGRNKIDVSLLNTNSLALVTQLVADMSAQPFQYVFLHLTDPDTAGHANGWDTNRGSPYSQAVQAVDQRLGLLLNLIEHDSRLSNHTTLIVTADHGGAGYGHDAPELATSYTIPFYAWGPGVWPGADLYQLNPASRRNPGAGRPPYSQPGQPIRNGDTANLALKCLGLEPVPGSTINVGQDLALTIAPTSEFRALLANHQLYLQFNTLSNIAYQLQFQESLGSGVWSNLQSPILGLGGPTSIWEPAAALRPQRFYRVRSYLP